MRANSRFGSSTWFWVAGLGLMVVLVLAACAPTAAPASAPTPAPVPTKVPPAAPSSSNSIQGIVWQWTSVTNQTTKQTTTVPNPASYTIIFNADGTVTGKADCNTFSGTYSQQNGFTIKVAPTVIAACNTGSLDQQYFTLLNSVAAGGRTARAAWRWKLPVVSSGCCSRTAAQQPLLLPPLPRIQFRASSGSGRM